MHYPKITLLKPQFVQTGVLSRNIEEAMKLKKKKIKKFKPHDYDQEELERLDLEFEEVKKPLKQPEEIEPYKRKPKPGKPEEKSTEKLKIGKGKLRPDDESQEAVTLKKVPKKEDQDESEIRLKPTDKKKPSEKKKPKKEKDEPEGPAFEPYDIKPFETDLEKREPLEEGEMPESSKKDDQKKPKRKSKKPEQESDKIDIVPGKPKPGDEDENPDLKLKYRQGPKPEDKPEEIKLKPWKKPKSSDDEEKPIDDNLRFTPHDQEHDDIPEEIETITTQEIVEIPLKKPKKITTKRITKKKGDQQQVTEVQTIEEDGKVPVCSVTEYPVEEVVFDKIVPVESETSVPTIHEEIREQVTISEITTEEGKPQKVTKKRTVKRRGKKQQVVEEKTIEEEGKQPIVLLSETINEDVINEDTYQTIDAVEEIIPIVTEEITEQVTVTETISAEGIPQKLTKKKTIKKKGTKQNVREEITIEEAGKTPRLKTREQVLEEIPCLPDQEQIEPKIVEDVTEDVQITETVTKIGKPKKFTKKKTVRRKGSVGQITEQIVVKEQGRAPVTLTISEPTEGTVGDEEAVEFLVTLNGLVPVEEITEQVIVTEEITVKGKPKKMVKKRVTKKAGKKQQVTETTLVEEEGKAPLTSVEEQPVEEILVDEITEIIPVTEEAVPSEVEEVKEQVVVSEEVTYEGQPKKTTKKRKITRKGKKQKVIEEITTEEGDQAPVVEIVEYPEEEVIFEDTIRPFEANKVEEDIELVPITETKVVEEITPQGKLKKTSKKRKVIKKADEETKIIEETIIEEEGKAPVQSVQEIPLEEIQQDKLKKRTKVKKPKGKTVDETEDTQDVKEGLKPQSVKRIENKKPQKPKIEEPEKPQFGLIKLKKAPVKQKDVKKEKFPKIMLRSRIQFFEWPPSERTPKISLLEPNEVQNGILSHNVEEALKLKKPKQKKKKPQGFDETVLEKLDAEFDELKKVPLEEVEDKSVYQRKPKKEKPEDKDERKLKMGKGKVPKDEEDKEQIILKMIPRKPEEKVEEEKPEIPVKQKKEKKKDIPKDIDQPKLLPFEPHDIEHEKPDLEERRVSEQEDEETPVQEKDKKKKPKQKPKKPIAEVEKIEIKPGVPEKDQPDESPELRLKAKQGPKPEEQPEEIKLKPWKKPTDEKSTQDKPDDEVKFTPTDIVDTVVTEEIKKEPGKKSKKIIKKKIIRKKKDGKPDVTEEVTIEEEGEAPVTTVSSIPQEVVISEEISRDFVVAEQKAPPTIVEETREEVEVSEVITEEGRPKKSLRNAKQLRKVIMERLLKK
ncbi:uncharacterized protein LOC141528691 [Cotesia typhae]|uniref:uncharacterized protein LOC141528691 n=1 Tax=Cotesia typhae TaxID=2053667 RepID=UPI003D68EBDE